MTSMDAAPEPARLGKWKRRLMVMLSSLAVVAACVAIRAIGGREHAKAENPPLEGNRSGPGLAQAAAKQTVQQSGNATSSQQPVVALVNGEEIHRSELAQECLAQFGKDVLETLMNKFLISTYCEQHNIKVTKQDVDAEIARLSQKFGIPKDQWLKMLQDERGIKPEQYANDIVWPTLALRKVAEDQTKPTEQEIVDAYETRYGVAVRARLIVLDKPDLAQEVEAKIRANPTLENFGALARKYSCDPPSASIEGRIMPIRRHMGDPSLEAVAFRLKDGEISPPVKVHDQFVMLYCEGHTEPSTIKLEEVRGQLTEFVRENKLRNVAADVFKKLQNESQIVNVYNDPAKRAQMPGVAATINGKTITIRDLSEACVDRHGTEVLEMMIQRKLVEQELKRRKMVITQQDLDAEIARAAVSAGK
ncbi:MAG TPA: peptidylprolyl isomerase, partial [Pirellulales bacterium]